MGVTQAVVRSRSPGEAPAARRFIRTRRDNANGHAAKLVQGRLLFVEGPVTSTRRFTREDYASNGVQLTVFQRKLVERLFEGAMTNVQARSFFASPLAQATCVYRTNKAFTSVHGKPSILMRGFDGRRAAPGVPWTMSLNPELFEVEQRSVVVGRDFGWRDLLSPKETRIAEFLLSDSYSSLKRISEKTGIAENSVKVCLTYMINAKMRAAGLPEMILRTERHKPFLYYINPAFAKLFGVFPKKTGISRSVFSAFEWRIIEYFAAHPSTGPTAAGRALNKGRTTMINKIKVIEEKARRFCLQAFEAKHFSGIPHYRLTESFAAALQLPARTHDDVNLFSNNFRLLRFVLAHPCARSRSIAKALGIGLERVDRQLKRVRTICETFGIRGFMHVGKSPAKYYATEEFARPFAEQFGWMFKPVKPRQLFTGISRKACEFFEENANASFEACAKKLGVTSGRVQRIFDSCNSILKAHCLPELEEVVKFKDLNKARDALVEYRIENGCWPSQDDLNNENPVLARALSKHHGGTAFCGRVLQKDERVRKKVAESDWSKLREMVESNAILLDHLVETNGRGETVKDERVTVLKSVRSAIDRGVEFASIVEILEQKLGWSRTIGRINELALKPEQADAT